MTGWLAVSGGDAADLLAWLLHSVLWHVVGRLVRTLGPAPAAVVGLLAVGAVLYLRSRRRRVRVT